MISYHLISDVGKRSNNEDNVGMFQNGDEFCFALADGLGGHGKGELASQIAVEQAIFTFAEMGAASTECLMKSFGRGQKMILDTQQSDRTAYDMKTTFVMLLIGKNTIQWAHIGDSRLYYFEDEKLIEHTLDHSVPQMLVAAGQLKEKQIRNHPDRNRLLRVMGIEWDEPKVQVAEPKVRDGKQEFLLCSDGFWELIDEKKMVACLKRATSPEDWLNKMEEIVLKTGQDQNMDNYSAVAVWID